MIFLITVVVPQFSVLYDQMGSKLPAMTLGLLAFGKWMQHNILWVCFGRARGGRRVYALLHHRPRPGLRRRIPHRPAGLRQNLAQISGGAVFAHALHAAHRRLAAGSVAWRRRRAPSRRARYRRPCTASIVTVREGKSLAESLSQHRRVSRSFRRDDHCGRADRRAAGDAQLGGRVL